MPSIGTIPLRKVRIMCEEVESLLKPPLLSAEERAALHATDVDPEERTKDDWWKRLAEVRSYARRKEQWTPDVEVVDESPVLAAIDDTPVVVELSTDRTVTVRPASYARVARVEDLDFLVKQVDVWRTVVKADPQSFDGPEQLLDRMRKESDRLRGLLYAEVCADGPAPLDGDDPPEWTLALTPSDELRLLDAWVQVNIERPRLAERAITRKYPVRGDDDDDREPTPGTLRGFPFLLAGFAYRENRAPSHMLRDRSLPEVLTTYAVEARRTKFSREKAEEKAEKERKKREQEQKVRDAARGLRR